MSESIKMLIIILIIGAAGKYVSDRVADDLRRKRKRSEAQTADMIVYAIRMNGKLGCISSGCN